jgi:hypothetical protein
MKRIQLQYEHDVSSVLGKEHLQNEELQRLELAWRALTPLQRKLVVLQVAVGSTDTANSAHPTPSIYPALKNTSTSTTTKPSKSCPESL